MKKEATFKESDLVGISINKDANIELEFDKEPSEMLLKELVVSNILKEYLVDYLLHDKEAKFFNFTKLHNILEEKTGYKINSLPVHRPHKKVDLVVVFLIDTKRGKEKLSEDGVSSEIIGEKLFLTIKNAVRV